MTLRDELMAIDSTVMGSAFAESIQKSVYDTSEAHASEQVLQDDYRSLYGMVMSSESYLIAIGMPSRDAHLVAIGVNLALTALKSYAERQFIGPIDTGYEEQSEPVTQQRAVEPSISLLDALQSITDDQAGEAFTQVIHEITSNEAQTVRNGKRAAEVIPSSDGIARALGGVSDYRQMSPEMAQGVTMGGSLFAMVLARIADNQVQGK